MPDTMSELKLAEELERLRDEAVAGEYDPSKMVALQMKAAFHIDTIISALRAAEAGRAAGLEGYALVPIEATEAMIEAGRKAMSPEKFVSHARVIWVWDDMVKVARTLSLPKHG